MRVAGGPCSAVCCRVYRQTQRVLRLTSARRCRPPRLSAGDVGELSKSHPHRIRMLHRNGIASARAASGQQESNTDATTRGRRRFLPTSRLAVIGGGGYEGRSSRGGRARNEIVANVTAQGSTPGPLISGSLAGADGHQKILDSVHQVDDCHDRYDTNCRNPKTIPTNTRRRAVFVMCSPKPYT